MPKQPETTAETPPETAKPISIEMVRVFRPRAYPTSPAPRRPRSRLRLRLPRCATGSVQQQRKQEGQKQRFRHNPRRRVSVPSCMQSPWSEGSTVSHFLNNISHIVLAAPSSIRTPQSLSSSRGKGLGGVYRERPRPKHSEIGRERRGSRHIAALPVYETGVLRATNPCKSVICLRSTGILMRSGSAQVADQALTRLAVQMKGVGRPLIQPRHNRRPGRESSRHRDAAGLSPLRLYRPHFTPPTLRADFSFSRTIFGGLHA